MIVEVAHVFEACFNEGKGIFLVFGYFGNVFLLVFEQGFYSASCEAQS